MPNVSNPVGLVKRNISSTMNQRCSIAIRRTRIQAATLMMLSPQIRTISGDYARVSSAVSDARDPNRKTFLQGGRSEHQVEAYLSVQSLSPSWLLSSVAKPPKKHWLS